MKSETTEIAVIGAGPGGSMAATLLRQRGWRVTLLERSTFPRFSIGESLLPQCMEWLEQAGMMDAMKAAGFQHKRGAAFSERDLYGELDYAEHYSPGWTWTWEVQRATFDQVMANEAQRQGVDVRFEQTVTAIDISQAGAPLLQISNANGEDYELQAQFVCDGSGFGRVLPRLLKLDKPSSQPPRTSVFTHIEDHISCPNYDREKILLTVHPTHKDVWYWLIPFSNGRASLGVTGNPEVVQTRASNPTDLLRELVHAEPRLKRLLANAVFDDPVRTVNNYAVSVSSMYGRDYALLGNAGEFIDPVFSSGVTLAMKSGVLACDLIDRHLRGQATDWPNEFEAPLRAGSEVFRVFVEGWYDGSLRDVFFDPNPNLEIRAMLCSILAGYVWDQNNPYVAKPQRRLRALCHSCKPH